MRLLKLLNLIKKGRLNTSQGFSLVELMVVVAIIGILAAIAIPNYQKFQARSKQTEARSQLSGIFASSRSFIIEWSYGSSNLKQIGYAVESSNMRYNCGWNNGQKAGLGNDVNSTKTRPRGYRGPLVSTTADVEITNTFRLQPGSIAADVNKVNSSYEIQPANLVRTGSGSNADTDLPIRVGVRGSCAGGSCSGMKSEATCLACAGGGWTAGATPGSVAVENSVPGSVGFVAGCTGDIGGAIADEWTINDAKTLLNTKQGI